MDRIELELGGKGILPLAQYIQQKVDVELAERLLYAIMLNFYDAQGY